MKLKKLCALLLTIVLALGLCACGTGKEEKNEYHPGNYVTFRTYPQTTSGTDSTPIEWLVLENDGKTALLISRNALDCQPYNTEREDITWEK